MRTDTIFYQLFLTFHSLLFELLGQPAENAEGYQFVSAEVKEKAFRFDGIFMPEVSDKPIYFVEVQYQSNPSFYWELLAEINIYLNQYKPQQDWKAVAIFAKRSFDPELTPYQQEIVANGRILRVYLNELPAQDSISIGLIQLIATEDVKSAQQVVQNLLPKARVDLTNLAFQRTIIELVESVLFYKFPKLSRQEIETMFALSDLKQTRVYQEALEEGEAKGRQEGEAKGRQEGEARGRQEGEARLALRQLNRKLGNLSPIVQNKVQQLSTEQLEELGDALLDFTNLADLDRWLIEN